MFEDHIVKPCEVQAKNNMQAMGALKDTALLATKVEKPGTMMEAMALFYSASHRSIEMQKEWQEDWKEWLEYASKLSGADTTSKLVARQSNIMMQASAQMSKQATEALELFDNILVGYRFWVSQQVDEAKSGKD